MWTLTWGLACSWLATSLAEPVPQEPALTHLFLQAHDNTAATASYRAVRLSDGESIDLGTLPSLPIVN